MMRMISKNKNGITLISLIVTIIVFSIILGITLTYSLTELHNVSNKKLETDMQILQEALFQRYNLVKEKGELEKIQKTPNGKNDFPNSKITVEYEEDLPYGRPKDFIGTRIRSTAEVASTFNSAVSPKMNYTVTDTNIFFEDYYYRLNENDLKELGIEKGDDDKAATAAEGMEEKKDYIVNYKTGEVFDIAKKKYYKTDTFNDDPVYLQPVKSEDVTIEEKKYVFDDE